MFRCAACEIRFIGSVFCACRYVQSRRKSPDALLVISAILFCLAVLLDLMTVHKFPFCFCCRVIFLQWLTYVVDKLFVWLRFNVTSDTCASCYYDSHGVHAQLPTSGLVVVIWW